MSETTYPSLDDVIAHIWGSDPEASYTKPELVEKMQDNVKNPTAIINLLVQCKMVRSENEQYKVNDFIRQYLIKAI